MPSAYSVYIIGLSFLFVSAALVFSLYRLRRINIELVKQAAIIHDAVQGNYNRRIRYNLPYHALRIHTGKLNDLLALVLQASAERVRIEQAQKTMISNISHDLRTPLTSILGYIEAVRHDDTLSASEKQEFLAIAHGKSMDLLELLESFFELSKIETDEPLPAVPILLRDAVENALFFFYREFQSAGIEPDFECPESPVYALGIDSYLQRILSNLISNALRHARGATRIGVAVKTEPRICIEVLDNGCGMNRNELQRIFDRLYTTEDSRSHRTAGNGLGLAIAKRLSEMMGGSLSAASTPDTRTVFTVHLREAPPDANTHFLRKSSE